MLRIVTEKVDCRCRRGLEGGGHAASSTRRRGRVLQAFFDLCDGVITDWTTCRALCEGHCGGPCRSGECMSIGPTPTAREDNALRSGNGRGRKGRGEDKKQDRRHAVTTNQDAGPI